MAKRVIVSKCLLGYRCRYDGRSCLDRELKKCLKEWEVVGVCPEELGGLRGRRGPFQIKGKTREVFLGKAKVVDRKGRDFTREFLEGAFSTLKIAKSKGVKIAILKSKSPSCSPDYIYDGSFKNRLVKGEGITCFLLKQHRIKVFTSDEFKRYILSYKRSQSRRG
ncbi:MAG: DUF523 domain-containing protein [Candidatus Omnitrophica bacterium]|nr:DUF523 domain-containing protein [Candidatus Omnitrophota bacterium]